VTANEIRIAATTVEDGPGASLLRPAAVGIRAVVNDVNRRGGICGRRLTLTTRNDGWDAARGRSFLRNFIEEPNFALVVVPSSEGLAESIRARDISNAGIPVVGSTGLRIDEYTDPWVFPVSASTVSIMRIIAQHAHQNGARSFGIVWDSKYRFGVEGRDAFRQYVGTLPGATVRADMPLDPDVQSYGTQAERFNADCGPERCDMVVMLLVPETALKWRNANPGNTAGRGRATYGAQTLFTDQFATACGGWCNQMIVWTGYNPPIPPVGNRPGVQAYSRAVKSELPSIDDRNQFLQGAYLGAQVFVDAAEQCSPNLTRECIRTYLNQSTYESDLSSPLAWRPNQRFANRSAQPFAADASGGSFNGWSSRGGFVTDPGL
jgi:ABC-type branched-subunit amino acid transport system substrate-binding protein